MANRAAWLKFKQQHPFEIDEAPMPTPGPDQVVIKTRAAGINPADAIVQSAGIIIQTYPAILGFDIAGEIKALGSNVKNFQIGDRVLGVSDTGITGDEWACGNGSFQLYCPVDANGVAIMPEELSFEHAAVIPMCLCVAALSMYQQDCSALQLPPLTGQAAPNGKVVLIWGGASTVGSCAIQLAKLSGYEVATTCSEHNFDYCRGLGASLVFDYKSAGVVENIVQACKGKDHAGTFVAYYDDKSLIACSQIASQVNGSKIVSTVIPPGAPLPDGVAEDIHVTFNYATMVKENEVGEYFWSKWLTPALADGRFKCKPEPEVVGHGLESVQKAVDRMAQGVSAKRLIVLMD